MSMNLSKSFKRIQKIPWQMMEDKALILTPDQAEAHELNETATWIWLQLENQISIGELVEKMCSEFTVDAKTAKDDIQELIEQMSELGMVECLDL